MENHPREIPDAPTGAASHNDEDASKWLVLPECTADEVESRLRAASLGGGISVLAMLQKPGVNRADALCDVLDQLADKTDDFELLTALVWRFALLQETWKYCDDTRLRTPDAFLENLTYSDTVKNNIRSGSVAEAIRRRKRSAVDKNWGPSWFDEASQRTFWPPKRKEYSKRMWISLAELSAVYSFEDFTSALEAVIKQRIQTNQRWKLHGAIKHMLPCDLKAICEARPRKHNMEPDNLPAPRMKRKVSIDSDAQCLQNKVKLDHGDSHSLFVRHERSHQPNLPIETKQPDEPSSSSNSVRLSTPEDGRTLTPSSELSPTPSEMTPHQTAADRHDTEAPSSKGAYKHPPKNAHSVSERASSNIGDSVDTGVHQHSNSATAHTRTELRESSSNSGGTDIRRSLRLHKDPIVSCHTSAASSACEKKRANLKDVVTPSEHRDADVSRNDHDTKSSSHDAVKVWKAMPDHGPLVQFMSSDEYLDTVSSNNRTPVVVIKKSLEQAVVSVSQYAERLREAYGNLTMNVRHLDGRMEGMPVTRVADMMVEGGDNSHGLNALDLPDLAQAPPPAFTQDLRLRLLQTLVARSTKTETPGHLTKSRFGFRQAMDIASSMHFNLVGFPGSESGAHLDAYGGTWIRVLHGRKWWMVVLMDGIADKVAPLSEKDVQNFSTDGPSWTPPPNVGQRVVLEPGDILIMSPGARVIHAAYSEGLCILEGGMFWSYSAIPETLTLLEWLAHNQKATNEPFPQQMPSVIGALKTRLFEVPHKFGSEHQRDKAVAGISRLRQLGCSCRGHCSAPKCKCISAKRSCTDWCRSHQIQAVGGLQECRADQLAT